jgi:hypothetical protein
MPSDDVLDGLLGEDLGYPADLFAPTGPPWDDARREAATRLLDAAVAVLAATGQLVGAAEEVLRERRDRLGTEPAPGSDPRPGRDAHGPHPTGRRRIDLSY